MVRLCIRAKLSIYDRSYFSSLSPLGKGRLRSPSFLRLRLAKRFIPGILFSLRWWIGYSMLGKHKKHLSPLQFTIVFQDPKLLRNNRCKKRGFIAHFPPITPSHYRLLMGQSSSSNWMHLTPISDPSLYSPQHQDTLPSGRVQSYPFYPGSCVGDVQSPVVHPAAGFKGSAEPNSTSQKKKGSFVVE